MMTQRITFQLVLLFVLPACFNACRTVYPSAEVNYLSGTENILTVRAVGIGHNREEAILNAEQKVFDVLFFRGLPESAQKLPLTGSNEIEEKNRHKKYFDDFYDGQRHKTFIMSSIPVSDPAKYRKGQKVISVDVKVNLTALRRDLETFGVIRKFGY
ncbi:MAG: hypothetical protein LBM08_08375 [Dysgonamonadaceae bacterium]|jgi:hypothetical protein|nr:hypothetical protein [Dysgonamonadaceae bacterium]